MHQRFAILFVLIALVTAACGGGASTATDATEPAAAPATQDSPASADESPTAAGGEETDTGGAATTIAVTSTELGDVLADGEGMTLYLFANDDQGASVCYDDCAQNWPPLVEPVEAGDGIDESLLGSVERDDGTAHVTYNDWPLYYFAGDAAPGDTNGHGVGDVWFAVDAAGDAVDDAGARQDGGY